MAENIHVEIMRFDPKTDPEPVRRVYSVRNEKKNTVLGALLTIREHEDSTLAFRYGCRCKHCGLCAVRVDGLPKMACRTYVRNGMLIEPLGKLPVLRDLVTEREGLLTIYKKHGVFLEEGADSDVPLREDGMGTSLKRCLDCLACFSTCCNYEHGNAGFMGPYFFVKTAQLLFDPRDRQDRRAQAKAMGIEKCRTCSHNCYCINGIDIYRHAIMKLLGNDV
ncbi:MAG: hypothetical protein LBK57_00940 [Clostridiales Family XIII bacterium]|jgi:succinate dehydrogenase/fumarate reductase iron-sulfur protein|nr:hypothetical protein [Clostridiales Family XIII bacterium]